MCLVFIYINIYIYIIYICLSNSPSSELGPAVRRRQSHRGARYSVSIYIENEPPGSVTPETMASSPPRYIPCYPPHPLLPSLSHHRFLSSSRLLQRPHYSNSLLPSLNIFWMLPYSCGYQCDNIHELNFRTVTGIGILRLLEKFSRSHPALMSYAWCSLSSLMLKEVVALSMRVL